MPDGAPPNQHPSRRSFGTARRIRTFARKPLGLNPSSGRSCPDPGRLSTFGVSGLYPCRRLTYRGACKVHPGTGSVAGQTSMKDFPIGPTHASSIGAGRGTPGVASAVGGHPHLRS
jgi:hypothetical protein